MTALLKDESGFDPNAIRSQFPILSRQVNGHPLIYFDNAATAQKPEQVIEAVTDVWRYSYANVHRGLHTLANEATEAFEVTRRKAAALIGVECDSQIVFTKGATEAINLVADSFGAMLNEGDEIILTQMEHHSNIVPWHFLRERKGIVLKFAPVTEGGELDWHGFDALFTDRTRLVSMVHMSNVLGSVTPARQVVQRAHAADAAVLFDGTQATVHMPIDVIDLGCDFYVFTGHKLYGPNGVGVLYAARDWLDRLRPYQGGGEMIAEVREDSVEYAHSPHKFEAGTPAIADVIGLGAAIDWVQAFDREAVMAHESALMDRFEVQIRDIDGLKILGGDQDRGAIISFVVDGAHPHDLAQLMDKYGVAVRAGHHCAHPLMQRFGVPGAVRASFALYNTKTEVDAAVMALRKALNFLI